MELTIEDLKEAERKLAAQGGPRLTEPLAAEDLLKARDLLLAPELEVEEKRQKELREAMAFARSYTGGSRASRRAPRRVSAGLP